MQHHPAAGHARAGDGGHHGGEPWRSPRPPEVCSWSRCSCVAHPRVDTRSGSAWRSSRDAGPCSARQGHDLVDGRFSGRGLGQPFVSHSLQTFSLVPLEVTTKGPGTDSSIRAASSCPRRPRSRCSVHQEIAFSRTSCTNRVWLMNTLPLVIMNRTDVVLLVRTVYLLPTSDRFGA